MSRRNVENSYFNYQNMNKKLMQNTCSVQREGTKTWLCPKKFNSAVCDPFSYVSLRKWMLNIYVIYPYECRLKVVKMPWSILARTVRDESCVGQYKGGAFVTTPFRQNLQKCHFRRVLGLQPVFWTDWGWKVIIGCIHLSKTSWSAFELNNKNYPVYFLVLL